VAVETFDEMFSKFMENHTHDQITMKGPIHFTLGFEFGKECPDDSFGYLDRKLMGPNRFTEMGYNKKEKEGSDEGSTGHSGQ
jgi:hypothetical protein